LVLKDEAETIAKYSFDIADDGANACSDLCRVTWKDTQVEAVISGKEQNDNQYIFFFNGKTDSNQLDTRFGKY
jgi:predicted lipoprotein with Yx(FWY)xxD motif